MGYEKSAQYSWQNHSTIRSGLKNLVIQASPNGGCTTTNVVRHHAIKLSLKRFEYMWQNFHTSYKAGNNGEDIMDDNVEDDVDDSGFN
jgi:hypothetical protein